MIYIVLLYKLCICSRLSSFQNISLIFLHSTLREAQLDAECFLGARNELELYRYFYSPQSCHLSNTVFNLQMQTRGSELLKDLFKPLQLGKCKA